MSNEEPTKKTKVQNISMPSPNNAEDQDLSDGFILVNKNVRKRRNGIFGNKEVNEKSRFKSAKSYVDLYLGRCDLNVSIDDISSYLNEELNIKTCNIMELNSKNPNAKSFKINVELSIRDKLLSDDVWPSGIICRKFYSGNKKS